MAAPQESTSSSSRSGADRIRSLRDQDAVFKAFDAYPWTKDSAFLSGLQAILGDPNSESPQGGSPRDIATHARVFYYAQRIGVQIDFTAYHDWLTQHPDHQPPNVLPAGYETREQQSEQPSATAWQQAAPKADLYIDRTAAQTQSDGGEPNYPMAFAEMIKLLQEGKPIPGIRQIPNSIERDPTVKPIGARAVPRKPWERVNSEATDTNSPQALDLEFPPVDEQVALASTAEVP